MEADAAFAHRPHPDKTPRKALKYKALWEQAAKDVAYWTDAHNEARRAKELCEDDWAILRADNRAMNRHLHWLGVVALIEAVVIVVLLGRMAP